MNFLFEIFPRFFAHELQMYWSFIGKKNFEVGNFKKNLGQFFRKKILKKNRKKSGVAQNAKFFFVKNWIFSENMKLSTSKIFWDKFWVFSTSKIFLKLITSKFEKKSHFFNFSKLHASIFKIKIFFFDFKAQNLSGKQTK